MQRRFKDYLIISFKGLAMGAADAVPGVSGGTIAFISGIYEELLTSISNVNFGLLKTLKKEGFKVAWKQLNGAFLASLFLGIFISIVSLAKTIKYLLENEPILLWSFFFGLVVASIIFIGKQVENWNYKFLFLAMFGVAFGYIITIASSTTLTEINYLFLVDSGLIFGKSLSPALLIFMCVFGVGTALAGVAGVIAGPVLTTFPGMATVLGSIVFVVVVIGGLGSLPGALIASLLVGLLQSYAIAADVGMPELLHLLGLSFDSSHPLNDLWTLNLPQIAPVLPYLLLVLVLIFKPTGLMGNREQ